MRARIFYAVIHAHDVDHGTEQAKRALDAGAGGIALINQYCSAESVAEIATRIRPLLARDRLLVNILAGEGDLGFVLANHVDCGVWQDSLTPALEASINTWGVIKRTVLCGFGFKYQHETDLETGYKLACYRHMQVAGCSLVPMISGRGTGLAPTGVWIRRIRALIGKTSLLAIASGMTPENIHAYLGDATHFLVGTSIEDREHRIVPEKVRAIADQIATYNEGLVK